jgi:YidC/Oxa1 family membrane protein insertase
VASPLRNQPEPEDQRNVIIATVLVAVILFGWMFWFSPQQSSQQAGAPSDTAQTTATTDTAAAPADTPATAEATPDQDDPSQARAQATMPEAPESDSITAAALQGTAREIVVETDLYTAVLSSKGATLQRFTLKKFKQFNQVDPVQIVDTSAGGTLSLSFRTPSGKRVDTRSLFFNSEIEGDTIRVEDEPRSITFATTLGDGELRQTYTFHPDDYDLGLSIRQKNPASFITASGYELAWHGGMPYSEGGQEQELTFTGLYAWSGGEVESVTLSDGNHGEKRLNGSIDWLAVKNKYFTAALMPDNPNGVRGATLVGDKVDQASTEAAYKKLNGTLRLPRAQTTDHVDEFHLYAGPVDYYNLASYERNLYAMVDYGWDWFEWITKPLAKYLYIPMLSYLGEGMPDWMGGGLPYGVIVILMAVLIKTVVYPLTKSSYRSMAQMRELQPKMEEIREKYDDDQEKQQEKMMELYRETGVNPLGGCLPMFLQYPILISLYQFIPKSIQLRQKSFLWASDLSAPDKILQLPFEIPFYGDYVAGFTLLMGLAMILTMRVQSTPGGGSQAKMLMYAMPAVIFFIFNRFASALSLYYLFYNIVTAAQQKWINMQLEKEKDEDGNLMNGQSDDDGSDGFFSRVMERARKAQEQQRKSS